MSAPTTSPAELTDRLDDPDDTVLCGYCENREATGIVLFDAEGPDLAVAAICDDGGCWDRAEFDAHDGLDPRL